MSYLYSDSNLMNNTETILQMMKAQQAEKRAFGNSVLAEVSNDSFNKTTKPVINTSSSNSTDDGKISFKEKMTNFGKGLVAPIKNMFSSPKNIALTALSAAGGAALIALTGGAAAPVMVAAGLIGGGVQIGKGIYKQSKATTDEQARQAWQQMGTGTFTVGISAASAKSALKANGVDVTGMSTLKAGVKCIADTPKNIVKGVSTASGKISAFMASSGANAETPVSSTEPETALKTPEKTSVDSPETKPVVDAPEKIVSDTPEIVVEETPKSVPDVTDTSVKLLPEGSVPENPASGIETISSDPIKPTPETPVNNPAVETVEIKTVEPATTPVSEHIPKKVAKPKNYTEDILLENGRIVKFDNSPKPYSEIILEKYKMSLNNANSQNIESSNGNVSILNRLKNIFKVFGFFKPKKI